MFVSYTRSRFGSVAIVLLGLMAWGSETRATDESKLPETPWPYVALDVELVRKLGHWGYYEGGCAYGAFYALLTPLQDEVGSPYTGVPAHIMTFGRGGIVGEGDLCGALLGALAMINLVADTDHVPLAEALLAYYREAPLPTDTINKLAREGKLLVDNDFTGEDIKPTQAVSITCRHSRREWMRATGHSRRNPARAERCARITGDVAAKAAELLNQWANEINK